MYSIALLCYSFITLAAAINFDENDIAFTKSSNRTATGATNTYAQAVSYGQTHPTRDGGSWNGWCASFVFRASNLPDSSACPSAIDAYHKSTIISTSYGSAPSGAYHWWDIGTYGHVAIATTNGWAMMASCHVSESWGDCVGVTSVAAYTSVTGAKYLGWSYDYDKSEIADVHKQPGPGPTPSFPRTATQESGSPDSNYYKRQQVWAAQYGYTGPIDGVLGTNSWAGTQRGLRNYGYTGVDDGVPGVNTYKAMQRLAAQHGYTGPVDGSLGPNSYRGLATYFNTL